MPAPEDYDPYEENKKPPTIASCEVALNELEEITHRFKSANYEHQNIFSNQTNPNYSPKILKALVRETYIDLQIPLRGLSEICSEGAYTKAVKQMRKILAHFSRPSIVLSLEEDDRIILEPVSSLLTVGHIIMNNFHPHTNRKTKSKYSPQIPIPNGTLGDSLDIPQSFYSSPKDTAPELLVPKEKTDSSSDAEYHSAPPSPIEEHPKSIDSKETEQELQLEQYRKKTTFVVPPNKDEIENQSVEHSSFSSSWESYSSANWLSQNFLIHYLNRKK